MLFVTPILLVLWQVFKMSVVKKRVVVVGGAMVDIKCLHTFSDLFSFMSDADTV